MSKAKDNSTTTTLTSDELGKLAGRLVEHADSIHNVAWRHVGADMRLAARALLQMSALRTGVLAIAAHTLDSMTADRLRTVLGETEQV